MTMIATFPSVDTGTPVTFECEGFRLVGSLHRANPQSRVGVVLLNQGPIDRGGSHRLYVKLANRIVAMGVPVLRFDARGVGESDGTWEGEDQGISILDVYGHVQRGVWTPDTLAAIDFMMRETGVERIVLGGLCGGAATALFAAASHRAVAGTFVIGTPVTFSAVTRRTSDLPDSVIERDAARYLRKLVSPSSWKRFFSFETDYRTLLHVFLVQVQRRWGRLLGRPVAASDADGNLNFPLFEAIGRICRSRKRLMFVFGTNDYLWQEFQENLPRFAKDPSRPPFDVVTIEAANHILTEEPWQQSLFERVSTWLAAFPGVEPNRHTA